MEEMIDKDTIKKWEQLDPEYAEALRQLNQMIESENAKILTGIRGDGSKDQADERGKKMEEKHRVSKEQLVMYIHLLRGLISYHKRMTLPHQKSCPGCPKDCEPQKADVCRTVVYEDIYLQAIEHSLILAEDEYCTRFPDDIQEIGEFTVERNAMREKINRLEG